jgi:hypothetical protein
VGLVRGPLSLMSTTEELLERKSSGSGLENRDYGRGGTAALTTWHPLSTKGRTNFATSGDRSVGIVRWRSQATEFSLEVELFGWKSIPLGFYHQNKILYTENRCDTNQITRCSVSIMLPPH